MGRVLYLSYDGLTDPLGQSQILPYLFGLKRKGYHITIISFEKKEFLNQQEGISRLTNQNKIDWHPLPYSKNPPVVSTLWDICRLRIKALSLHKEKKFDIVHCRSYVTSLIGLELKTKKHVKFVFDMRGFWADERIDGQIWSSDNPVFNFIYKFFKKKEKDFLTKSDYSISLTTAGKRIIESRIVPNESSPVKVIPCCVDNEHFEPSKVVDNSDLRDSLGIEKDQFVLGYVGSIGTWYMLAEMVDFFSVLVRKSPDAIFLFISREDSKQIEKQFQRNAISTRHLRVISSSRSQMPSYISLFNWSIFFIKPVFSKQASSPTKQGELMSMGIPIICNTEIGDTDDIVRKYKSGVSISEFSKDSYQDAIDQIVRFKPNPKKIREGSIDFFSLDRGTSSYAKVYEACLS